MLAQISVNKWHTLPEYKKEILRKWAVKHNLGLDLIPSSTADTCDYAALLSLEQMKLFLEEIKKDEIFQEEELPDDFNYLWHKIQKNL